MLEVWMEGFNGQSLMKLSTLHPENSAELPFPTVADLTPLYE